MNTSEVDELIGMTADQWDLAVYKKGYANLCKEITLLKAIREALLGCDLLCADKVQDALEAYDKAQEGETR